VVSTIYHSNRSANVYGSLWNNWTYDSHYTCAIHGSTDNPQRFRRPSMLPRRNILHQATKEGMTATLEVLHIAFDR